MVNNNKLKQFVRDNQIGMALIISAALFTVNIAINPASLNANTFGSIIALTLLLSFASAGQTMIMITGGIDLSVGAVMSMAAIFTANTMAGQEGMMPLVLVQVIPMALIVGLINGVGVVKLKLPAMVITMCVSNVVTRLQYVYTQGLPTGTTSKFFTQTLQHRFFGFIPAMSLYAVVIFIAVLYLLNRSRFGQQLFLTGNNKNAAYLAGIRKDTVEILAYVIGSLLAGVAGIIGAGYMNFVICQSLDSYTMMSIVAVVVGGTLLIGGKGSYLGTAAGALLIIVLGNCLSVLNSSDSVRSIIMGGVLILLLALYNKEKPIRQ
ncbi:ABC transporter permease [Clostridiales bacterium BAD-6]|uniref:Autoinducer 2 import system permease protein LsrD n=1 Tax=Sinanaerobacter chloroacetimidivorans TaxID=2818044 RepID=A0A8J7W2V4_9FIRM|nr:ABC transporter permease [Sinanaerobacter chloroacetimidivorans]